MPLKVNSKNRKRELNEGGVSNVAYGREQPLRARVLYTKRVDGLCVEFSNASTNIYP